MRPRLTAGVRLGLGLSLAVALTAALAEHSASGAFSATTTSSGNAVRAATNFCQAAPTTLSAVADSYVSSSAPTTRYGDGTRLSVRSEGAGGSGGNNHRALLRFALPPTPSGCALATATLRLYNASPSSSTRTIQVFRAAGTPSWTEATDTTGVTWNTAPAPEGTASNSVTPLAAGWQEWAVTGQLTAMYAGTDNGFVVRDQTEGANGGFAQSYISDEATEAARPQLVLTWN